MGQSEDSPETIFSVNVKCKTNPPLSSHGEACLRQTDEIYFLEPKITKGCTKATGTPGLMTESLEVMPCTDYRFSVDGYSKREGSVFLWARECGKGGAELIPKYTFVRGDGNLVCAEFKTGKAAKNLKLGLLFTGPTACDFLVLRALKLDQIPSPKQESKPSKAAHPACTNKSGSGKGPKCPKAPKGPKGPKGPKVCNAKRPDAAVVNPDVVPVTVNSTADDVTEPSEYKCEYDPETEQITDLVKVVAEGCKGTSAACHLAETCQVPVAENVHVDDSCTESQVINKKICAVSGKVSDKKIHKIYPHSPSSSSSTSSSSSSNGAGDTTCSSSSRPSKKSTSLPADHDAKTSGIAQASITHQPHQQVPIGFPIAYATPTIAVAQPYYAPQPIVYTQPPVVSHHPTYAGAYGPSHYGAHTHPQPQQAYHGHYPSHHPGHLDHVHQDHLGHAYHGHYKPDSHGHHYPSHQGYSPYESSESYSESDYHSHSHSDSHSVSHNHGYQKQKCGKCHSHYDKHGKCKCHYGKKYHHSSDSSDSCSDSHSSHSKSCSDSSSIRKKDCKEDDLCYCIPSLNKHDILKRKIRIDERGCNPFQFDPKTKPVGWTFLDEDTNLLYIVTKDKKFLEPPIKFIQN